jgi:pyruvate formate-lyase/glycerol dehydratase family glycyl radical enzyme
MTLVDLARPQTRTLPGAVETPSTWGTFEHLREHLFAQFMDVPFEPNTGLAPSDLEAAVRSWLENHPDHPRVLQKAHTFRIVVTQGQICVDPQDWFVDKLNHGKLLRTIRDEWLAEVQAEADEREGHWNDRLEQSGVIRAYYLDLGHISPGWDKMFSKGLSGLIEEARSCRERLGANATPEQLAFYDAVEIVYQAAIDLSRRFAALAREMIAQYPEHSARLEAIARTCDRVPANPPRTFYEALQFAWLMHELIEMEGELVRSMGHFDRIFYPFYRADIDAGRLTPEQAIELIQFFWFKYYSRTRGRGNGKNFVFGGQYADGTEVTNELTYLALQAYEELGTPDPKLSVRFLPDTSDRLYRRVADLIRRGHNSFVLMNDIPAVEGLVKKGKTIQDARTYLPIGCYEPAVDGKEVGCTMYLVVNLAKGIELALHDGMDPLSGEQIGPHTGDPRTFVGFQDLVAAYTRQMDFILTRTTTYMREHEATWPQVNPSPFIAGTIDDCLERGQDIGQGGAHYNSTGCVGVALANAADSLLAVKQTVFDERRFTMQELVDALDQDFEGQEPMRQYLLNRVPKWGNDDPEADRLARRLADHYCDHVHTLQNGRGGTCQAALFTLEYQWSMGKKTGALPDGRKARESLAPGVGPTSGRDMKGATALVRSVSKLDFTNTPNGAVLDVTLHPTAIRGDEGLEAFVALIKTFFAHGGYALQFNVFDAATLRSAQRNPERYASLQIRVTGWSVYFVTLTKDEQDQFILRNAHCTI